MNIRRMVGAAATGAAATLIAVTLTTGATTQTVADNGVAHINGVHAPRNDAIQTQPDIVVMHG